MKERRANASLCHPSVIRVSRPVAGRDDAQRCFNVVPQCPHSQMLARRGTSYYPNVSPYLRSTFCGISEVKSTRTAFDGCLRCACTCAPQKVVREYSLHCDQNVLSSREVFLAPLLKTCDALLLPCLFGVGTFCKVCAVFLNINSRSVPSTEVFPQMAVIVLSSVALLSWH